MTKRNGWIVGLSLFVAVLAIVSQVEANSSSFSWTMNKLDVNGKKNDRFHRLTAGILTLEGHIEITERMRASVARPTPINVDIHHSDESKPICSGMIIPDHAVGTKKPFSLTCGSVRAGTYWIHMYKSGSKPDGDAWHNTGSGTLTTR
jgi:hypothetical protein